MRWKFPKGRLPVKKEHTSFVFSLLIALCFCRPASAQQGAGGKYMHVIAPGVGWVLMPGRLYWTTDGGGQWSDITPKSPCPSEAIVAVFFLDTSNGWVLLSGWDEGAGE